LLTSINLRFKRHTYDDQNVENQLFYFTLLASAILGDVSD